MQMLLMNGGILYNCLRPVMLLFKVTLLQMEKGIYIIKRNG